MSKWVICASGPSMAAVDVSLLRRCRSWNVLAVNCTWQLVPFAAALYAGDLQWWERYIDSINGFSGERWTRDEMAAHRYRLRLVRKREGRGLCRERGFIHAGGNSGFQAINLAWHFGARQIVLLGFDMHRDNGGHWHAEHEGMLSAPASHLPVWRHELKAMAADLRQDGVEVVNCTDGTALDCFPTGKLRDHLC